jgi:hypothetical protein
MAGMRGALIDQQQLLGLEARPQQLFDPRGSR